MSMSSPFSPGLSTLFMEFVEEKSLEVGPHALKYWGRYVDDTGMVTKKIYKEEFFAHINEHTPAQVYH